MQRYYFDTSLAPISYGVVFLPFPVDDVVRLFERWKPSDGTTAFWYVGAGDIQTHVKKVSARRHELAGLLKPQNSLCRFVFVPTKSKWTAVFAPHSIDQFGYASSSLGRIAGFACDAAREMGLGKYSPCCVEVKARPRRTLEQTQGKHPAFHGDWGVEISSTGSWEGVTNSYAPICCRLVEGSHSTLSVTSYMKGSLDWFGLSDIPEIDVDLTPYLEENASDDVLRDVSDEAVDKVWENFNFDDIDYMCRQLGIDVFDDAFYGTEGYLAEPWDTKYPYYEIVEDRIPFATYQQYRGLPGDDVIRAWTSNPPATND